ncbi:MAG: hypothetical protein GX646_04085 [Bacteroidales bacterium]|jgi:hypothetical protein|nr:hypothetical protein [Bacteroidales bacterium]NLD63051.1 hypothetical protein [Bacteroidales bacterium]
MKRSAYMILMLAMSLAGMNCFAQTDTVLIETELQQDQEFYYRNKYRYLDVRLGDEDRLLKIGIQPFKPSDNFSFLVFTLHGGFEQKINTSLTAVTEINSVMTWTEEEAFHQQGISLGGRYYFLKKREIEQGRSGNNCQGVYGLFKMSDLLSLITLRADDADPDPLSHEPHLERFIKGSLTPEVGIGYQQRLDYHLYFDSSLSCNYNILDNDFGFQICFLFGVLFSYTK